MSKDKTMCIMWQFFYHIDHHEGLNFRSRQRRHSTAPAPKVSCASTRTMTGSAALTATPGGFYSPQSHKVGRPGDC